MSCVTWHLLLLGRAQPLCVRGKEGEVLMSAATLVVASTPCMAAGKGQHGNLFLALFASWSPCLSARTYTGCDI